MPVDLTKIQSLVAQRQYSVKSHAVRHMLEEGFDERSLVEAVVDGKILEEYPDNQRCLVLGHFQLTPQTVCPLHVVCDYSDRWWLDIVTAYIPQKPEWETPWRRGKQSK